MKYLLAVVLCLMCCSAFGQYYGPVYYESAPVYYAPPPIYYAPPVYYAPRVYAPYYYDVPNYYYRTAPYYYPRVWVHPKVYVEGQPIRNFFQSITP